MKSHNLLRSFYELELLINRNVQNQFSFAESLLKTLNEYCDPILILNLWIPLVGSYNHKLLMQLATSLGLINTITSLIKWCFPEYRPIWWIKEQYGDLNMNGVNYNLQSCETSGGFPSSHVMAFTVFAFVLIWRFVKLITNRMNFLSYDKHMLTYAIVLALSTLLWISRLYFFNEFLHQCILTSWLAIALLFVIKRLSNILLHLSKFEAFLLVIFYGLVPISVYFAMLFMDMDPFWSVRMAFKWCADPLYLKHESTPVFTLCRDFGYLLGIALSCPLAKSYTNTGNNYRRRLPVLIIIEIFNYLSYTYTPKQQGRFIFVAYEFVRNCGHSFALLTVLAKLGTKQLKIKSN